MSGSPEKQQALEHLNASRAVVSTQMLGAIDNDSLAAAGTFLRYFVVHHGGLMQADGEGFYVGEELLIGLA